VTGSKFRLFGLWVVGCGLWVVGCRLSVVGCGLSDRPGQLSVPPRRDRCGLWVSVPHGRTGVVGCGVGPVCRLWVPPWGGQGVWFRQSCAPLS